MKLYYGKVLLGLSSLIVLLATVSIAVAQVPVLFPDQHLELVGTYESAMEAARLRVQIKADGTFRFTSVSFIESWTITGRWTATAQGQIRIITVGEGSESLISGSIDPHSNRVRVSVQDENSYPLPGVQVAIYCAQRKKPIKSVTGREGVITLVTCGIRYIDVQLAGFNSVLMEVTNPKNNQFEVVLHLEEPSCLPSRLWSVREDQLFISPGFPLQKID